MISFWCLYYELWTDFIHCFDVYIINFNQVYTGWVKIWFFLYSSKFFCFSGTHLTFNSCIINITSLDKSGNICGSPFEYWRDRHGSYSDLNRANVQTMHTESNSRQFLSVATEKKIMVKNLPNLKNYAHAEPVESNGFVVKAEPMMVEGKFFVSI